MEDEWQLNFDRVLHRMGGGVLFYKAGLFLQLFCDLLIYIELTCRHLP